MKSYEKDIKCIMDVIFSSDLYNGGRRDKDNAFRLALSIVVYLNNDKEFIENYIRETGKKLKGGFVPKKGWLTKKSGTPPEPPAPPPPRKLNP